MDGLLLSSNVTDESEEMDGLLLSSNVTDESEEMDGLLLSSNVTDESEEMDGLLLSSNVTDVEVDEYCDSLKLEYSVSEIFSDVDDSVWLLTVLSSPPLNAPPTMNTTRTTRIQNQTLL